MKMIERLNKRILRWDPRKAHAFIGINVFSWFLELNEFIDIWDLGFMFQNEQLQKILEMKFIV